MIRLQQKTAGTLPFNRLSEPTMRAMWETAMSKARRNEAFELTPQEVKEFSRTAPKIAATDVADATATTMDEVADAEAAAVGEVDDPGVVTVDTITALNQEEINTIGQLDELAQELLDRIKGAATSPAQLQLKRSTEQNLKQLLGLQAGAALILHGSSNCAICGCQRNRKPRARLPSYAPRKPSMLRNSSLRCTASKVRWSCKSSWRIWKPSGKPR